MLRGTQPTPPRRHVILLLLRIAHAAPAALVRALLRVFQETKSLFLTSSFLADGEIEMQDPSRQAGPQVTRGSLQSRNLPRQTQPEGTWPAPGPVRHRVSKGRALVGLQPPSVIKGLWRKLSAAHPSGNAPILSWEEQVRRAAGGGHVRAFSF